METLASCNTPQKAYITVFVFFSRNQSSSLKNELSRQNYLTSCIDGRKIENRKKSVVTPNQHQGSPTGNQYRFKVNVLF